MQSKHVIFYHRHLTDSIYFLYLSTFLSLHFPLSPTSLSLLTRIQHAPKHAPNNELPLASTSRSNTHPNTHRTTSYHWPVHAGQIRTQTRAPIGQCTRPTRTETRTEITTPSQNVSSPVSQTLTFVIECAHRCKCYVTEPGPSFSRSNIFLVVHLL